MLPNDIFIKVLALDLKQHIKSALETDELVQSIVDQIKLKMVKPEWTINSEGLLISLMFHQTPIFTKTLYKNTTNHLVQDTLEYSKPSHSSNHTIGGQGKQCL